MPDVVYITFDSDRLGANIQGSTPQQNTTLTGTVMVDYVNKRVTTINNNPYEVKGDNGDQFGQFSVDLQTDANGNYFFTDGRLRVNWTDQVPSQANLITYDTDPSNTFSDKYSSTDEPTPQLTSSTSPPAPCFATGTVILTAAGPVVVERLAVGDRVVTAGGAHRRVAWIGHRDVDCAGTPELRPVRVAAGAFGAGLPARDLWLSPGHPVLVGADEDGHGNLSAGHLVPIMCLVNGTTIERMPVDRVTYWHIELDTHDILLAEGLPAESYLDWGDRVFFTEGADHALANPDFVVPGLAGRCRPVALGGPVVEAERRRLDAVFAARLVGACAWPETRAVAWG